MEHLKNEADLAGAEAGPGGRRQFEHVLAGDDHPARRRHAQPADDGQQRRLAATARAADGHELAGPHVQTDVAQGLDGPLGPAIDLADVLQMNHGRGYREQAGPAEVDGLAAPRAAAPAATGARIGCGYCELRSRCFAAAFRSLRSFFSFTDSLGLLLPDRLFCSLLAIAYFLGSWFEVSLVVRPGASITSSG